jgi:hypothetical protein
MDGGLKILCDYSAYLGMQVSHIHLFQLWKYAQKVLKLMQKIFKFETHVM